MNFAQVSSVAYGPLFDFKTEVRRCEERRIITCGDTELKVGQCSNACDIPDDWEKFMVNFQLLFF